jgi:hypothetical protein
MEKELNKHDFSGSYAPGKSDYVLLSEYFSNKTFSVGIFQWIPKADGKGMKKSAVKYRIYGLPANKKAVYKRAQYVCRLMDLGWKPQKKSERLS